MIDTEKQDQEKIDKKEEEEEKQEKLFAYFRVSTDLQEYHCGANSWILHFY